MSNHDNHDRRQATRRWLWVVVGFIAQALAVVALAHQVGEDAAKGTLLTERTVFTKVCEANNIVKAEGRIAVRENKASPQSLVHRRDKLFVILDCGATFRNGGRGVPLTEDQQQRYMDVIRRDRIPNLHHGEVVGSHEPEQDGTADF